MTTLHKRLQNIEIKQLYVTIQTGILIAWFMYKIMIEKPKWYITTNDNQHCIKF